MTPLEDVLKVAIHATSKINKYCAEVLSNCLLIPKPKFKISFDDVYRYKNPVSKFHRDEK